MFVVSVFFLFCFSLFPFFSRSVAPLVDIDEIGASTRVLLGLALLGDFQTGQWTIQ